MRPVLAAFILVSACAPATAPCPTSPAPHDGAAALPAPMPQPGGTTTNRDVLSHPIPAEFGEHAHVQLVEVTYPPGGFTHPHRHPCAVVGYVLEGAVRMQLRGAPEHVYRAGESFYEDPSDVHLVSANASQHVPARFLALFVCHDEHSLGDLLVPVDAAAPTPTKQP